MNCPAKLISKAFFSRLVRSPTFSRRGLVAGPRDREGKTAVPFISKRTFYVGKREVEVDEDKGNARNGKRKTGRGWKMKKKDESARCCVTDLTSSRFLPDRQSGNATPFGIRNSISSFLVSILQTVSLSDNAHMQMLL